MLANKTIFAYLPIPLLRFLNLEICMIFQGLLASGLAFQNRVSSVAPVAEQDFKDYQNARHKMGLTPDAKVDKGSELYKAAEKLLVREENSVSQFVALLRKSAEDPKDPLAALAQTHLESVVEVQSIAISALASLRVASTQRGIENAVNKSTPVRYAIATNDEKVVKKNLDDFKSNPPLHDKMAAMYAMYQNDTAKAFLRDLNSTPLGSPAAAESPPTADPAKLPPVPKKDPVMDLNLPANYEQLITDSRKAGEGQAAAVARENALARAICQERKFLLSLEKPDAKKQLDQLEVESPGIAEAIKKLTVKYKELKP